MNSSIVSGCPVAGEVFDKTVCTQSRFPQQGAIVTGPTLQVWRLTVPNAPGGANVTVLLPGSSRQLEGTLLPGARVLPAVRVASCAVGAGSSRLRCVCTCSKSLGRLDHSPVHEHRAAGESECVDLAHVHGLECVAKLRMLELRWNGGDETTSDAVDVRCHFIVAHNGELLFGLRCRLLAELDVFSR